MNTEEIIALGESNGYSGEFTTVNEITGYHQHGDDVIATSGSGWKVGTKKGADGRYDHDSAAHFDDLESAKKFIDGGKKGSYKNHKGETCTNESVVQESFIDLMLSDKVAAEARFRQMMSEKVQAALGARRIEIAQTLYSRVKGA
jgi:hypothetical protein